MKAAMRPGKKILCAVALFGLTMATAPLTPANAGEVTSKIVRLLIYDQAMVAYVFPEADMPNKPPCHTSANYYSFSLTRPAAKEYLAGLLAAQLSGVQTRLVGKGVCTDLSSSETLDYFNLDTP